MRLRSTELVDQDLEVINLYSITNQIIEHLCSYVAFDFSVFIYFTSNMISKFSNDMIDY